MNTKINLRKLLLFTVIFLASFIFSHTLLVVSPVSASTLNWTTRASMPTARWKFGIASTADGMIYAIGGRNDFVGIYSTVEKYNPSINSWTALQNMPTARFGLSASVANNGKIYAIGGYDFSSPDGTQGTVEEYDPVTNTWTTKTSMPTPRADFVLVNAPNGKLYAIGGNYPPPGSPGHLNTVEEYDPVTDTWATKSSMPVGECCIAGSEVNGKIYVFPEHSSGSFIVQVYDPITDSWSIGASMPTHRWYLGGVAINGEIFAVGGYTDTRPQGSFFGSVATVEAYDVVMDSWVTHNSLQTDRMGLGVTSSNGKIYAIGGLKYDGSADTYVFLDTVEEATIVPDNLPPTVNAGGPYQVNEGGSVQVSATGNDPENGSLTYAWDLDNNGNFETPGQSVNFSAANLDGPSTSTIAVQVTDDGNLTATDQGAVNVLNVAPTVGVITTTVDPVQVNTSINASASFTDPGTPDTHTAAWDWGDGTTTGTVTESNGSGSVSDSHTYSAAGVYTVKLTVTDDDNDFGESIFQYVVVYDPSAGFVTGAGTITSPLGAYTPNPLLTGKAIFGFISRYQNGANVPTGSTQFRFVTAQFTFNSTSYDWLVVGGPKAQYKGSGTINGSGDYGFILSAIDGQINGGGGADKFRIKIYDKTTSLVIYDNQIGASDTSDPTTVIDSGSIMIHN